MSNAKILLQVTGSIAAFKAVALCSKLIQNNFEVEVIMSESALQFIGPASFEGLTGKIVHHGNFEEGKMMAHIHLERWADLILLYPATANTISSLAHASGESLIGALFLAHEFKKPYFIAPAMNQAMFAHPGVQQNLNLLKSWGVTLLEPDSGALACGEVGAGRLMEPEAVLEKVMTYFKSKSTPVAKKRILITSGGTSERIDPVRSLTNFSTGQTGYSLADSLNRQGYDVTLLQSKLSSFQFDRSKTIPYDTTEEFAHLLQNELETNFYDVLIHAAAVADYAIDSVTNEAGSVLTQTTKIQSDSNLILKLKPNPKLLKNVRAWSKNKNLQVISFKLTTGEESDLKLDSYDSDAIIHNELSKVNGNSHSGTIYTRSATGKYNAQAQFRDKTELANQTFSLIEKNSPLDKGIYS